MDVWKPKKYVLPKPGRHVGQKWTAWASRPAECGNKQSSFDQLARLERWELSLEALALKPQWGPLFSDEEANEAIHRLLEAGCHFL